ncbi:MAG: UxaA family hydrolase [Allomuricauda sp.]
MSKSYVQIDPKDNIIVAITNLEKGTIAKVNQTSITLKEDIKGKHKFALNDFEIGDEVIMYGVLIGKVTKPIKMGCAITTDNVKHASASYNESNRKYDWTAPDISRFENRTFKGYHRKDGKVGTANYWLVIPLTFCENRNVEVLEGALLEKLGYETKKDFAVDIDGLIKKYKSGASSEELYHTSLITTKEEMSKNRIFPNVDGIKFLRHDGGCGGTREDAKTLCNLLAGYIANPNVAGATVLSLGCQNAQIQMLQDSLDAINSNLNKPIYYLEQQQSSSERQFIEDAVKHTFVGLTEANKVIRKSAPLSKLVLGLECGGSDGFSGISANPALGYASDLLAALGGSPVLAEFPELNGVEQNIIDRCETNHDAKKFYDIMRAYSDAAVAVGSGFENNPSPGNIKDGLITDAMKSAGAAKKGGTSPVVEILDYTEQITRPGLNLLCTPGNDVESTTGLAGSGCNVIVFTTGLGTPTGNPVAPVLKMSSNTELFEKMGDIIDINAGTVISGEDTIESMGEKVLEHIIKVASGETPSKAVQHGHNDFIPWKRGVSL